MAVDKQVTIRLEARDDLTPVLRRAAASASSLAGAADKTAASLTRMTVSRGPGLSGIAADAQRVEQRLVSASTAAGRFQRFSQDAGRAGSGLRSVAVDAGRAETALTGVGARGGAALSLLSQRADAAAKSSRDAASGFDAFSPAMLAIGLGVGAAAKSFMDFDKNMAAVAANTGATGATLDALRQKAIELGAASQYSGAEAAAGINELAKAGVDTTSILQGGLQGALALAAAGQMEVADAAETAASAMTQFGLQGAQVPHVADLLAAAANSAQGSVHDMGMALNQTGLVAHQAGLSIEETVGGLTAFAKAGLTGSDAGTSFKTMLQRLNPSTVDAKKAMAELGISAFDSQGNFVGLANVAGQLQKAMGGLTTQQQQAYLMTIFGQDAIRGANVLMTQGADGIRKYTEQVNDFGAANRLAAGLTNNLSGDLEKLGGSIDSVILQSGSGLNETLRALVQGLTRLVDLAGTIPAPLLQVGAALVAIRTAARFMPDLSPTFQRWTSAGQAFRVEMAAQRTGMAGLSGAARELNLSVGQIGTLSQLAGPRVGGLTAAFRAAGGAAGVFRLAAGGLVAALGGPWGIALAGAGVALSLFAQHSAEAKARQEELKGALDSVTATLVASGGAWTAEASKQLVAMAQSKNLIANYQNMGYSIEQVTTALTQEGSTRASMIGQIDAKIAKLKEEGAAYSENGASMDADKQRQIDYYEQQRQNLVELIGVGSQAAEQAKLQAAANQSVAKAAGEAASGSADMGGALGEMAGAAKDAQDALMNLANAVTKGRDAQADYWATVDETRSKIGQLSGAVVKGGDDFDVQSKRGRDAQKALLDLGNAARDAAIAQVDLGKGTDVAEAQMSSARKQFIATAQKMGLNTTAANALADQLGITTDAVRNHTAALGKIPGSVTTRVSVIGLDSAFTSVTRLLQGLDRLDRTNVTATARIAMLGANPWNVAAMLGRSEGGVTDYYARGGVRERHVAQIAPAGAWRVWAEDETGGEAYIPLHPAKRARSTAILEEVARRFGLAVSRQANGGLLSFAQGGVAATVGSAAALRAVTVARLPVIDVQARVTKVTIPAGVKAPFLYTPGGAWDRSKSTAPVDSSKITAILRAIMTTPQMVADQQDVVSKAAQDAGVRLGSVTGATAKATAAAKAAGKIAGQRVVAASRAQTAAASAVVTSKLSADDRRAAALVNALGMDGRGSYRWGGGHTATYYRNAAALAADCSGFVGWAVGRALGRNVTSTASGMLKGNSALGWVKIDPRIAAKTAGAILGNAGHVVMSLGDGRVIESYKTGKPVRIRALSSKDMQMAAWNTGLGPMHQATAMQVTGGKVPVGAVSGTAKDLTELAQAQAKLAQLQRQAQVAPYVRLAQSTATANRGTRQFLANIRKIRDRGYPGLAFRLLELGEDEAAVLAASMAGAPDQALRQQRDAFNQTASYQDQVKTLTESLGKIAGPAAWVTATREAQSSNAKTKTFLDAVQIIAGKGFGTLAAKILEMGVDEGYDLAVQARSLDPKSLRNMRDALTGTDSLAARQERLSKTLLGPQYQQLMKTNVTSRATSATFLANIRKIRDRGFAGLALKLMEMGEDAAKDIAAEAATATDASLRSFRDSFTGLDDVQKQADDLLASLKGIGQVLTVTVGAGIGTDPTVRYAAPRAVDARPVATAPWTPGRAAPLLNVENITVADARRAITDMTVQLGDAVAVTGVGRMV